MEVFLERGYAATSIDAVVARAGGSKETLYKMFGNKEGLLRAVCDSRATSLRRTIDVEADDQNVEDWLKGVGERYLTMLLDPRSLALYRLLCAEATRMPQVGDMLYRAGPGLSTKKLAERLISWEKRGEVTAPEAERIASLFYAMLRDNMQIRAVLNPSYVVTAAEIQDHAVYVVKNFLRLCHYRPSAGNENRQGEVPEQKPGSARFAET